MRGDRSLGVALWRCVLVNNMIGRTTLNRLVRAASSLLRRRRLRCAGAGVCLAVGLAGCSTSVPQRNDWSTYSGPGAEYFRKDEYKIPYNPDPLEPFNRVSWAITDVILFRVIEPVSAAWRFLIPQDVRSHLVNAVNNLNFPVRAVNNLLQGESEKAGDETDRFLINSTVGIAGLFDPATEAGIDAAPEDLGRTFQKWGWRESPYLVLPVTGPSTFRDALGRLGDLFLDPTTYFFPAGLITRFITGSEVITEAKRIVRSTYDAYGPIRYMWTSNRRLEEFVLDEDVGDGPASQTLGVGLLRTRDPWFLARARESATTVPTTGKRLPYDLWLQPGRAPIVYIVPGMGAHRRAGSVIALAEIAHGRGFSVVTVSSSMNFEFMESAATISVPGFTPIDAHDLHIALDAINRDLEKRFSDRISARVFMGLSLGAFHGLTIAAKANPSAHALIDFDRYVLLSPPVSLRHAAERLDAYYNVPLAFPEAHREAHVRAILRRALAVAQDRSTVGPTTVMLSETDAQFLVGLDFRMVLHDAIWSSQRRHNMGVLKSPLDPLRRAPVSSEILDFSFMESFYAFVFPASFKQDDKLTSEQQMFHLMDARSLTETLPNNGKIRVFASENDFLVTDADRQWLIRTLGKENVTLEPRGGHMGGLAHSETQQAIMDALEDLLPAGRTFGDSN